jgi:hypothetical protein
MQPQVIVIEPGDSQDAGRCDCCGNLSRTVWGYVYDADVPVAAYYVNWTLGRIDHGANFDLVVGKWGEGASLEDRSVVALAFQWSADGPQFIIIDAAGRPSAKPGALAATALRRDQVVGTPLASKAFEMLDAIWIQDERIGELTHWAA